ncbi:MAG: hypothetical protein PUB19_04630 [Lachnospiraceae bacterium]|nr:hypothetical protein [Lachnospiraceae bacterium]
MDKIEFKTKYEEMKDLLAQGKTEEAMDLVDSINWRKVHNVNVLVKASEICVQAGRLEEAKELLYMAHERSPIGRMIIYHLAMLCVKMGELDEAKDFYEEFVEIAPHDSLKYIIKYQISKAKGADNTTLIAILEELKEHDFTEEWAYELAYLYHKTMQVDKCIDLCDEIILWFGDGPYVERALEMKMIYQPLDKMQEDKYRHFQQKRDGITEIRANELLQSGEIVPQTIAIPRVELPADRFNTINLQAEIKKNIDEIMRATEEQAVSENMENIKNLVEEIPYLQVSEQEEALAMEKQQASQELDATIVDAFQGYLAEEYDGQISLLVPEQKEIEEQISGQMTIEDVMEEWEKTRRAAEATLQEAQQLKLESAKNIALMEASQIMDRLEEAMPKLDAGATSTELLKEEYMSKVPEPKEEEVQEDVSDAVGTKELETGEKIAGFQIPKLQPEGTIAGVGLEIPVVDPGDAKVIKEDRTVDMPVIAKRSQQKDTKEWQPPELESMEEDVTDVDLKEASKIVADMNDMLQQEIDRILQDEDVKEVELDAHEVEVSREIEPEPESVAEEEPAFEEEAEETEQTPEEEDILPEIEEVVLDSAEMAELLDEAVLEQAISEEVPTKQLSEDEKEIFSYFMPIAGMESSICQALTGARYHLDNRAGSGAGNFIIQGGVGSGKTMLASNIIKVLQTETGKLGGNVGKIDAAQLNHKDVKAVLPKVEGGCLIIEQAADLNEETMESMRQLMSRDDTDVLVFLEDEKNRIEKTFSLNTAFAAMFTEKITIPIFTIDELVNFGKVYALEEGYALDEMAILAMYNRINLIQRLDHPTSLIEVRDIMEEAIDHAEKGGIRGALSRLGTKRYDEEGNLILREQDFEI